MEANFFKQIAQLEITGDLHLIISKGTDSTLVVSTMLNNEHCGDKAKKNIIPFNLNGTAEELDKEYFKKITTPIQTASGLMTNMEAFMKQLETAQKQSAMEKGKADTNKNVNDSREKKYKDAMDKASELEKAGKHREAWMKVPEVSAYPEKEAEIRRRKKELSDKFSQPDLFGEATQEKPQSLQDHSAPVDDPTSETDEQQYEDNEALEEATDEEQQDY